MQLVLKGIRMRVEWPLNFLVIEALKDSWNKPMRTGPVAEQKCLHFF